MAGPFEIAVGVLTAVDFGFKLYTSMDTFVTRVKNADKTAQEMARKVDNLRNTFYAVSRILKKRKEQLNGKEPESDVERLAWVSISNTISSWCWTVEQFKASVDELETGPKRRRKSWVGKMLWHMKHGDAIPVLQGFESDITRHHIELSLTLQCLNTWERAYEKNSAPAAIEDGVHGLDRILKEVDQPDNYGTGVAAKRITGCIAVAQATKIAIKGKPITDRLIASLKKIEILREEDRDQDMRVDKWADDGDGDGGSSDSDLDDIFDDTTPREMADALIKNYLDNTPVVPEDKESLGRAEYHQRRLLTYAEEWNEVYEPPINLGPIQRKLADIMDHQGRYDESRRFLKKCLSERDRRSTPRQPSESSSDRHKTFERSEYCYRLAGNYLSHYRAKRDQKHLDRAEMWAKRSVTLRIELRDDSELFSQAVHRLVEAVQLQTHSVEAEVYSRLYLAQSSRKSSEGSVKSSGSSIEWSRVAETLVCFIDEPVVNGVTMLIAAIQKGDLSKAEELIQRGASCEARDAKDRTPLLHAAFKRDDKIIDMLITKGANVDARCNGDTALHYAICAGNSEVLSSLLNRGAGVEVANKDGLSPLLLAVREGRDNIVLKLCEREPNSRPDLDAQDTQGMTALHHAVHHAVGQSMSPAVNHANRTDYLQILRILLSHQANPDIRCTEGLNTPLHEAVIQNHEASAKVLLKYGANVNSEDSKKRTPLVVAIRAKNRKKIIMLLVNSGAYVDKTKFDMESQPPDVRKVLKNPPPPTTTQEQRFFSVVEKAVLF